MFKIDYKEKRKKLNPFIAPVLILFGIYLLGISAILRANFNYIDDMGRAFAGYRGWSNFSRYLSSALSIFIHTDKYLTDISPIPQLLAILLLSISVVSVLYIVTNRKKFTFMEYLTSIFLGLNPYFLECLSYKYDAPYMALSVLASILPLLFYNKKKLIYGFSCFLSAIIVCTTYQVSCGILPMFVLFLSLTRWNSKENTKDILEKIMISILGYGFGLLVFQKFLMSPVNTYVSTEMASLTNMLPNMIKNYSQYFTLIQKDFKIEWLWLIIMIGIMAFIQIVKTSKQNKIFSFVVSIIVLGLMLLLSFGIYPLLISPLFSPRAMYGFGIFLFFLTIPITTYEKNFIGKLCIAGLAWIFFIFSFTYGNALFVQKTYTDYRIQQTISDLNSLNLLQGKTIEVQVTGSIGHAPLIRNMPSDYQILNRLVPVTFGNSNASWEIYGFDNYYNLTNVVLTTEDLTKWDLPILKENIFATIRGRDNYVLIELKE